MSIFTSWTHSLSVADPKHDIFANNRPFFPEFEIENSF